MKNFIKSYKYKIIFILFASVIIAVVFALFSVDGATNSKNLEFISSYGWEVDSSPADIGAPPRHSSSPYPSGPGRRTARPRD